jgi:hypothetical protein
LLILFVYRQSQRRKRNNENVKNLKIDESAMNREIHTHSLFMYFVYFHDYRYRFVGETARPRRARRRHGAATRSGQERAPGLAGAPARGRES